MKTRYKRIGKRSVSVLLSILMILSTLLTATAVTVDVERSKATIEVQSSGTGSGWFMRGEGFYKGTLSSDGMAGWTDGVELQTTNTDNLYYVDILVYSSTAAFKICDTAGSWAKKQYGGGVIKRAIDDFGLQVSGNSAGNSANITFSKTGAYRVVFRNDSKHQIWATSIPSNVKVYGGGIRTESGSECGWSTSNAISFSNTTDPEDCYVDLYINKDYTDGDGLGFKLYNSNNFNDNKSFGGESGSSLNISGNTVDVWRYANDTRYNPIGLTVASSGIYRLHYNSILYQVWLSQEESTTCEINIDNSISNGSISVNNSLTEAAYGTTVTFTATPTNTTDYYTSTVTVTKDGGGTVEATPTGNAYEYSFTMPDDDVTIGATFAQKQTYTVTTSVAAASTGFGTVSASATARTGESVTITATPETDYNFSGWTITGDYTFASGSTLSSSSVTIYPTSNVTLEANFVPASITRIYFHDKAEMGLPQVYFWNNSDGSNNNTWPGYGCVMTPVDGFINMYYVDIDTSAINYDIDRLIINNMYRNTEGNKNMGAQTKDYELASGKTITDYNNKVFVVDASYDNNDSEKKYGCTVPSLNDSTFDFDTYTNETNRSTNGVKLEGDSGYQRIYFYDKNKKFTTGYAYVQYGTGDNDFQELTYQNVRSTSSSSNYMDQYFPGKRMTPITDNPNYNSGNLYYADVPLFTASGTRRLSFSDGYQWTGGNHITKSVTFPNAGNIVQLNGNNTATGQGSFNGYTLLSELNTGLVYSTITQEHSTVTDGTINVWAKDGTVRDSQQNRNDGQYSEYIATTNFVCKDGTTISDYSHTHFNNHVAGGNVQKGKTITITTTINAENKNKRYVKAFCINGFSHEVIEEPSATDPRRTSGIYTCEYTIPENLTETDLEITPIFFYLTDAKSDNKSNEYINFYAEDFVGGVQDAWGKTLSCYAWYDEKMDKTEGSRPATGGYPGQPMVYLNGSHLMQIPRYTYYSNGTRHEIQGVTMNNYYWDDVHYYKGYLGSKGNNCQTYDYDDFVSLMKVNRLEDIIFSFKYRTANEGSGGNRAYAEHKDKAYLYNTPGKLGNGWNALVDYYDYSVDIFGNRVPKDATSYYKESDIEAQITANIASYKANGSLTNNFVYIVSNGYETGEHDYIGYYATKWYIYNSSGEYLGALPPSAFEWNIPDEYLNADLPDSPLDGFLGYSEKALNHSRDTTRDTLWYVYKTIYNTSTGSGENKVYTYRKVPAVITYETSYGDKGTQGDYGFRGDGRWYFSRKGSTINASTKIQIVDSEGNIINRNDTFVPDGNGGYIGTVTQAHAHFTNTEFNKKTESGNVIQNPTAKFTFEADEISLGSDGKYYEFLGWYLSTSSSDLYPSINVPEDIDNPYGERAMSSNATFVARYRQLDTGTLDGGSTPYTLIVTHNPYANADRKPSDPTLHNGSGSTAVTSVVIHYTSGSGKTDKTIENNKTSLTVLPIDLVDAESVELTLASTPDTNNTNYEVYYYDTTGSTSVYKKSGLQSENTSVTNVREAKTGSSLSTTTYIFNVADIFDTTTQSTDAQVRELNFFADFRSDLISINIKYYDRNIVNNVPTTISTTPSIASVEMNISGKTIQQAINDGLLSGGANNIDKYIGNVIDKYRIWPSQTRAVSEFPDLPYLKYATDSTDPATTDIFTGTGKRYIRYKSCEYSGQPDWNYHVDYYGVPCGTEGYALTNPEKWVTYYDASGKEIKNYDETTVGVSDVASVTVWAYNTPQTYNIDVYAAHANDELESSCNFGNNTLYYDLDDSKYLRQIGFFNQRLGGEDTDANKGNSNDPVEYLSNYGVSSAYLGQNIVAETDVNTAGEGYKYVFDGWYQAKLNENGEVVGLDYKITSDKAYGYRITTDLTIVACYKKVHINDTVTQNVGLSLTDNGVDYYVVNGVKKVRINTQMNIYGASNANSDGKIKQLAIIYVQLPPVYKYNGVDTYFTGETEYEKSILSTLVNKVKTDVEAGEIFADPGMHSIVIDISALSVGTDEEGGPLGENGKTAKYIDYTYDVSTTGGTNKAVLTNKNRTQFVLGMKEVDFQAEGRYSAVVVFGAMNYDTDGDNTTDEGEWIVSDNYVSYITNKPADSGEG